MYKFGIAYYQITDGTRVPHAGIDVRLVIPGDDFSDGIAVPESALTDGYYEAGLDAEDAGYYEIWDDVNNPLGAFSGKTTTIGPIGSRGLQDNAIAGQQIMDGVVTADKIAAGAITTEKVHSSCLLTSANLTHELQDNTDAVGSPSDETPPTKTDTLAIHTFASTYEAVPLLIITPLCAAHFWISSTDVSDGVLTVEVGIDNPDAIDPPTYQLLAIT